MRRGRTNPNRLSKVLPLNKIDSEASSEVLKEIILRSSEQLNTEKRKVNCTLISQS